MKKLLSKDIKEIKNKVANSPLWATSLDNKSATKMVKNEIESSNEITKLVIKAATEGLEATQKIFLGGVEVDSVPDFNVRHKYWRDILIMKGWLSKDEVNVNLKTLTINAQEEEILRRYAADDAATHSGKHEAS